MVICQQPNGIIFPLKVIRLIARCRITNINIWISWQWMMKSLICKLKSIWKTGSPGKSHFTGVHQTTIVLSSGSLIKRVTLSGENSSIVKLHEFVKCTSDPGTTSWYPVQTPEIPGTSNKHHVLLNLEHYRSDSRCNWWTANRVMFRPVDVRAHECGQVSFTF